MNKDEIILMLRHLVDSLQGQLDEALRQLGESNSKVDALLRKSPPSIWDLRTTSTTAAPGARRSSLTT